MIFMNELVISEKVEEMINPVYLVGGSVRDMLIGRNINDLDFCTPHTPDEIEKSIRKAGRKPYLVGKRFGTVACKVDGEMIEITTFRTETYESGNRKPEVNFVSQINHDLSRRDFTINAIAKRGDKIIDPFNGIKDLDNHTIRCVGNPRQRFKEDPLRMLRACRFSSQLGFKIEENTFEKMQERSHSILTVSKERWVIELDKLLLGDFVKDGIENLLKSELMKYIIPELSLQYNFKQMSEYHDFELHEHTIKVIEACPKDLNLRWAALLHDIAKPFLFIQKNDKKRIYPKHELLGKEIVEKNGLYLRWSNERIKNVSELVLNHLNDDSILRKYDNESKVIK